MESWRRGKTIEKVTGETKRVSTSQQVSGRFSASKSGGGIRKPARREKNRAKFVHFRWLTSATEEIGEELGGKEEKKFREFLDAHVKTEAQQLPNNPRA